MYMCVPIRGVSSFQRVLYTGFNNHVTMTTNLASCQIKGGRSSVLVLKFLGQLNYHIRNHLSERVEKYFIIIFISTINGNATEIQERWKSIFFTFREFLISVFLSWVILLILAPPI